MIHDIGGVGRKNEIKDVSDGYALNFLIPQGHAVHASAERIKAVQEKVALEKRALEDRKKKFIVGLDRIKGAHLRILARANDKGGLYSEITAVQIVTAIQSGYGVKVPTSAVVIPNPIKSVGLWPVEVTDGEYTAQLRANVIKNGT
jgi:large subunit ribosomal protein L9